MVRRSVHADADSPTAELPHLLTCGPLTVNAGGEQREVDGHDDGVQEKAPAIVFWPMLMGNFINEDVFVRRSLAIFPPSSWNRTPYRAPPRTGCPRR